MKTTIADGAQASEPVPLVRYCIQNRIPYARGRAALIAGTLDGYQDQQGRLWVRVGVAAAAA